MVQIGDAVLGAFAGELLRSARSFKKRQGSFESRCKLLESTLESLKPRCDELEVLYRRHGRYHDIADIVRLLNEGRTLIEKCSKVRRWNIYKKGKLAEELEQWDASVIHFCQMNLQLQISTTVMENSMNAGGSRVNETSMI